METQVLIVGAGPTGLSLAAQFIRHGIDFIIIDEKEGITHLSKALGVHARTLEIYEQIELAQPAIERGAVIHKMNLLNEGQVQAELDLEGIGTNMSPYPFVLILEQSENERLLYDHVKSHGKDVWWQTKLDAIAQDGEGVTATVKSNDGRVQEIRAKYLVGCDGASSETRHLLGLGFAGTTIPKLFYVADVEMECGLNRDTLYPALGPDSFVLFFPMRGEKHWRLIGNMPELEGAEDIPKVTYEQIEEKVKALSKVSMDITNVRWFSTYKVHTRHAESFWKGRCFLAGDAAHIHTPAGGQGMNTGIQDGYNLAWKIAFVLNGRVSEKILDSYNEERIANAERLLKTTDQLFDYVSSDEWYFQLFRNHILPPLAKIVLHFDAAKEFIFPTLSQIGISYDKQSLSRHGDDVNFAIKAGNRFPYFVIEGKSCYDDLRSPKFKLVTFFDGSETLRFLELSEWVEHITFPLFPHISDVFGSKHTFSVLVRPDNYIGFVTGGDVKTELDKYFSENLHVI